MNRVFGDKKVHVYCLSPGGIIAYYLALKHPEIVKSLVLQGMTSCLGLVDEAGDCNTSFHFLKWFFSLDLPLRLLGTKLQAKACAASLKMQSNKETMYYFQTLSTATMTRTPRAWNRYRRDLYHERIPEINVPTLHLAGEHDALVAANEVDTK